MPDQMSQPQLRPEDAATACAGCGHPAAVHEVGVDEWPCLVGDCSCAGFNTVSLNMAPVEPLAVESVADAAALATARSIVSQAPTPLRYTEAERAVPDGLPSEPPDDDLLDDPADLPPADAGLSMTRRPPPARPKPTPPRRPDGIALRFARAVAAAPPPPGEWVRLNQRVSRGIVNPSAREFADAFGLRLSVRLDLADPDDPNSDRYHHLFCEVLTEDEDVSIEARP